MKEIIPICICLLLITSSQAGIITVDVDPDRLLEAKLLALEVEGQLTPSEEGTEQIYNDLASIRSAYPEIALITYIPRAVPDEIMIRTPSHTRRCLLHIFWAKIRGLP